jgi:hypothetical protein
MPKTKSTLTTGKNAAISTKEAQVELAMLQKRQAYLQKVLGTAKPMQTRNPFIVNIHTCGRTWRKVKREYLHEMDNEHNKNEPRLKKAEKKLKEEGGDWYDYKGKHYYGSDDDDDDNPEPENHHDM